MIQILQGILLVSFIFFIIILIMAFLLLIRVGTIKKQQALDLALLDIVDAKTGRGYSAKELVDYFRRQFIGLLSITAALGVIYFYGRQNPAFIQNTVYAGVFIGILLLFGWIVSYSVIMSSTLIINNIVNRFRR